MKRKMLIVLVGLATIAVLAIVSCAGAPQPTPTTTATRTTASPSPGDGASTGTRVPGSTVSPTPPSTTPSTPGTGTPSVSTPVAGTPTPKQSECPKLESRLYGLTVAADPAAYASANNLYYVDGRTRVVVELQQANGAMPGGYNLNVEARQEQFVQATAFARDLCRLSNEPQVRFVRVPFQAVR